MILTIGLTALYNVNTNELSYTNVEESKIIEVKYSGYQLKLISSTGGYGINGQSLGHSKKFRKFNISENDEFYLSDKYLISDDWMINPPASKNLGKPKIIKFEKNNVLVEFEGQIQSIPYNKNVYVPDGITVFDGPSTSFEINITKL